MGVFAIDPGNEMSAWVFYGDGNIYRSGYQPNDELLFDIGNVVGKHNDIRHGGTTLAVEMIASYGMPVGREVFDTCVWIGRFVQAWCGTGGRFELIYRRDVKLHLCGSCKAKDGNVRQALIDLFGPGKSKAIGLKASPGPLYGISGDVWAALAVAVTYSDRFSTVVDAV